MIDWMRWMKDTKKSRMTYKCKAWVSGQILYREYKVGAWLRGTVNKFNIKQVDFVLAINH